jgi:hypothetical protein
MSIKELIGKFYSDKESMVKGVRDFATKNGFAISLNTGNGGKAVEMYCSLRIRSRNRKPTGARKTKTCMDPETNCQWKAYGNLDKINKKWRLTKLPPLSNHCHDLLSDAKITQFIFPSARKLDEDTKQDVLSMLRCAQPNTVKSIITRKGKNIRRLNLFSLYLFFVFFYFYFLLFLSTFPFFFTPS